MMSIEFSPLDVQSITAKVNSEIAKASDAMDRELLCGALRLMVKRFAMLAKESGYTEAYIRNCTEQELSLVNRCQLQAELKGEV
jgi:hypothetical protein